MMILSDSLLVLIYIIFLIYLLVLHSSIVIGARKSALMFPYWFSIGFLAIWLCAILLEYTDSHLIWQHAVLSLRYLGICGLGFSIAWLGKVYHKTEHLSSFELIILAISPAMCWWVVLTNQWHSRFVPIIDFFDWERGFLFYIVNGVIVVHIMIGLLFFLLGIKKHSQNVAILLLFLLGILLPVSAGVFYLIIPGFLHFNLIPALAVVSSSFFALAAVKFRFLDIMPVARRDIMNEMDSALVIARDDAMVIDCNTSFLKICNADKKDVIGKNFTDLISFPLSLEPVDDKGEELDRFRALLQSKENISHEMYLITKTGIKYFEIMVQPVFSHRMKLKGRLYRLTELEREKQLRELLSEQNQQLDNANISLSKRTEMAADLKRMTIRNQLARELHDQLGHVVILTLSSIDQIELAESDQERWHELDQLVERLRFQLQRSLPPDKNSNSDNGIANSGEGKKSSIENKKIDANMGKNVHNNYQSVTKTSSLEGELELNENQKTTELKQMLTDLQNDGIKAGIDLQFDINGDMRLIPASHNHNLLQICRETMTNAIKHGNAKQINYFWKIANEHYDLIIVDNGKGADDYSKGFGLSGMEKRVGEMGGSIRFQCDTSGFAVFLKVPLHVK